MLAFSSRARLKSAPRSTPACPSRSWLLAPLTQEILIFHALSRWSTHLALALGALVLFVKLGSSGLWEPWETDRADLARTLALPPEVITALPAGADALAQRITTAAEAAGARVRAPSSDAPAPLRAALSFARADVIAALVIDTQLLISDWAHDDLLPEAAALLQEAREAAAGGVVILLRAPDAPPIEVLKTKLETALAAHTSASPPPPTPSTPGAPPPPAVTPPATTPWVLVAADDPAALTAALATGVSASANRVAFKSDGKLISAPPLGTWLRALAYRTLGVSEGATRLPGALALWLALWVVVATAKRAFSPRVAALAGCILATLPLFFSQARVVAGEPIFILAMTLVGSGLLLQATRDASRRTSWLLLTAGLILGTLTQGAYALTLFGAVALATPLVAGPSRRLADWLPAILFFAAAALAELISRNAAPGSLGAGLGFVDPLFTAGPSVYSRTFDMVIRELGFGMAPWSPLVAVAAAILIFSCLEDRDPKGLVVAAWFILPIVGLMVSLKVGNHFLYVGLGAAALATALFIDRLLRGEQPPHAFIAMALVMMIYIMRRELRESPEPLVSFLAFDPPFAKEGPLRFPEALALPTLFKQSMIVLAIGALAAFGRLGPFLVSITRTFRAPRARTIALAATALLASITALAGIGRLHGIGMSSRFVDTIQASQKALVRRITGPTDPMMAIGIALVVTLALVIVLRWIFPRAGQALGRRFPAQLRTSKAQFILGALGAAAWLALTAAALGVTTPAGYFGELLLSPNALVALVAALTAAGLTVLARHDAPQDRWSPILAGLGVLGLTLGTQLSRDASLRSPALAALALLGFFAFALLLGPWLLQRVERVLAAAFGAVSLVLWSYTVPLIQRGEFVAEFVRPDATDPALVALQAALLNPIFIFFTLLTVSLIVLGILADRPLGQRLGSWGLSASRAIGAPRVFTALAILVAVIGAASYVLKFEPALAINVSEKHVVDTWREHGGADSDLFKHGSFGAKDRRDRSFYTAAVPEIRSRDSALKMLVGRDDEAVLLETPLGTEARLLPGWDPALDQDQDGRRDAPALHGRATALTPTTLTDATQAWQPRALIGQTLRDANGQSWKIVDNDATSIRVDVATPLTLALTPPRRALYTIDGATTDRAATAERRTRRALLLPAGDLSELNYAFRQLSGGIHLPVLDGSGYRVLLATSWLAPGETTQNRLALVTYTAETFAALRTPRLVREWGNFEDTIEIVGYETDSASVATGGKLGLTIYYKTLKPVRKSLKVFIHLDKGGGGARIAGDHWPLNPTRHTEENKGCTGCYRTDHWLPGDIVADRYDIEIPEGNTGEYTINVGLYEPGSGNRLKVTRWEEGRVTHDGQNRLGLGTILVK